jgi:hypothetical protein
MYQNWGIGVRESFGDARSFLVCDAPSSDDVDLLYKTANIIQQQLFRLTVCYGQRMTQTANIKFFF